MITSHFFIRCIITRASITKKHKETNFLGCYTAVSSRSPGAAGVEGALVGAGGGESLWNPTVILPPPRWGVVNTAAVLMPGCTGDREHT